MTTNNSTHQETINLGNTDTSIRRDGSDLKFKDGNNSELTLSSLVSGGGGGGGVFASNLVVFNNIINPNSQIGVDADAVGMLDSTTNAAIIRSVSETFDITTDLDTGSETSDTWYYFWLVSTDGSTITRKISTSSTAPTGISSTDFRLRVGSVYNDSSSNFRAIRKFQDRVQYQSVYPSVATGTATAWASISLTAYVPPITNRSWGIYGFRGAVGGTAIQIIITGDNSDSTAFTGTETLRLGSNNGGITFLWVNHWDVYMKQLKQSITAPLRDRQS